MSRPGETVYVRREGCTMYALTARRTRGRNILAELFPNASWHGGTLLIDHRYVADVIAAVGGRIKFERAA